MPANRRGAGIVGRLLLGPVADRVGVVPLFKATVLVMALSYAVWLLSDYVWLVVFAAVLGTSYGSRIAAVPPVALAQPDLMLGFLRHGRA